MRSPIALLTLALALALILCLSFQAQLAARQPANQLEDSNDLKAVESLVQDYCLDCHVGDDPAGGLDLESLQFSEIAFSSPDFDTSHWESMIRRISAGQMPPANANRPAEKELQEVIKSLNDLLDRRSRRFLNPGRTNSIRRLTRLEYQNSIRELLGMEVDVSMLLPKDESSHGFDNITVNELSPTLLDRYLSAAEKISRQAVGSNLTDPLGITVRIPPDVSQENHVDGLPLGTRGGTRFKYHFPQAGKYEIELKLARDRDERVEGLFETHEIVVLLGKRDIHRFMVERPPDRKGYAGKDYTLSDAHLRTRIQVPAGTHEIGVTFVRKFASLMETKRQPFDARYNRHRHPRRTPAIFQISLVGPMELVEARAKKAAVEQADGQKVKVPSDVSAVLPSQMITQTRRRIFAGYPAFGEDEVTMEELEAAAEKSLRRFMRFAYRRPVVEQDVESPLEFFRQGYKEQSGVEWRRFEAGMELALTSILVNPSFLFRVESEPAITENNRPFPISDVELASRLSFFLWSSPPDAALLELAEQGKLSDDECLKQQVRRMLADKRSKSLVDNFADQWLYLRNLQSITPDMRLFPDFDDNLRQAFRDETKHLFAEVINKDRNVLNLIESDHTFLNERLAMHYGIPGVRGSHFRKINLPAETNRGGLLRHGSILTVTSYATRTSPTIRGSWILENIFGTPPPPPPDNVPALKEKSQMQATSVRERLAMHRADLACASCHNLIDPVGFALENFDAVGRWRQYEDTVSIDSTGTLPDGMKIRGVEDLEAAIMKRPEMFVGTLTEKLLTFGLGRGVEHYDGPAVRRIVAAAKEDDFRFSKIVEGVVLSDPFRFRNPE